MPDHSFSKEIFPNIQSKLPLMQLEAISSCPTWACAGGPSMADGPSHGPTSSWAGCYVGFPSCCHLSVLLHGCADEVLSCNLTAPNSGWSVVRRASSSTREWGLHWVAAHHGSALAEWQDCTGIKPLIGQRRPGEAEDQNIIWMV